MWKTPLSSLLISCELLSQSDVSTAVTMVPRKERAEEEGRQKRGGTRGEIKRKEAAGEELEAKGM